MSAFIAKFYELIIYCLLVLLVAIAVWGGWQKYKRTQAEYRVLNAEIICQGKIDKKLKPYLDAEKQGQKNANEAAKNYEQQKEVERSKTETITREVQKIVERPIYIHTNCFDDDGVSAVNAAGNSGKP
ncbi:hypothetical protein [Acinetobacter sp. Ver3]|uniref:hypothetical protein n=1 Tax=Acinetobacter sp. Ver3 TaxID=466088 RepID=UPI00044CA515|nr:hypothetical protein [Acinetobacter sp. Ver3]EZQ12068.1 hypothetical protein CL42_01920 [Acinetobacter sp. Ver3]